MPRIRIANFRAALQADAGFTDLRNIGAYDMRNFDISTDGYLSPRNGSSRLNAAASELGSTAPVTLYRAYNMNPTRQYRFLFAFSDKVYFWDGTNFTQVTNSPSLTASPDTRTVGLVEVNERLFFGSGNTAISYWIDLRQDPGSVTPSLYRHGMQNPTTVATCADGLSDSGTLTAGNIFRYAYTYYNNSHALESNITGLSNAHTVPATRKIVVTCTESTNTVAAGGKQVDKIRIYRTKAGLTADPGANADVFYLAAVDNTPGGGTTTYTDDGTDTLSATRPHADYTTPPAYRYIAYHGGRIFVADNEDSYIYACQMDSAFVQPLLDNFPDPDNKIAVSPDDGDVITGLQSSPVGTDLLIFKDRSVTIMPVDVTFHPGMADTTRRMDATGTKASRSIAQVGELVYFFGTDKKIWATNGATMQPVSVPRVQALLDSIDDSMLDSPVGTNYKGKYILAYPSSTSNNDRALVFDPVYQTAVQYDNWEVNDFSWWDGHNDQSELYAAMADEAFVRELLTGTQDNSADFTESWLCDWFLLPSEYSIVTGVYVIPSDGGGNDAITVRVDTDGTNGTAGSYTPAASNLYRIGQFARGRRHRVFLSSTDRPTISELQVEFELDR